MKALVYAALLVLGLLIMWMRELDKDLGGYRDSLRTRDKLQHLVGCFALTVVAVLLGVPLPWAAGLTLAFGIGWEVVQSRPRSGERGFFSWLDVLADSAGVGLATLLILLIRAIP